jgi:hypothetical protein
MLAEESNHLATDLQPGNVGVQIDAVQALEVEHNVPVEQLIDVPHFSHAVYLRENAPWP